MAVDPVTPPDLEPARTSTASDLAIDIEDVVGRYPRAARPSVDHVSLKVRSGTLLGLLGPNGAGKTTLLSMLCALMRPQSGGIRVHGLRFDDDPEAYKDLMGLVPQALALYPRLTGRENLAVFGGMSGLSGGRLRARMDFAIGFAGLGDIADRRVESYSGGLMRRLNLATALLPDPPVLVLDEPTVGIDPQSRHAIHESLRQLSLDGKTIIYTSHYLEEIEQLCDDVAILDRGRMIAQGSLGALLSRFTGNQIELRFDPRHVDRAVSILRVREDWEVSAANALVTLAAEDAYKHLPAILTALAEIGLRPVALSVGPRDLEQAFLQLTGTELRDTP